MQEEKKKVAVLTNDQQLFLMKQVKSNGMSVENALKMAKQLSEESQDLPPELKEEKKKFAFAGDKASVAVLTNDQQLFLMEQVKSNSMSVENALKMAKQLSEESQDLPPELRKEPKSPDILNSDEIYNFAIILYENGFSQPGTMCCMQIDFAATVIRIIVKCRIKFEILFQYIKEFYNEANSNELKIVSTGGTLEFTANSEDKDYLFELLGMVIVDNECAKFDSVKKKELDRQSMNLVFRNRNILKEGILEKKVDANMLLWLKRHVVIKEGEFSYTDIANPTQSYFVQIWTDTLNVEAVTDSEFTVTHKNMQYTFRIKNKNPEDIKAERDSWMEAFWKASARKNIKTKWMKNVRLSRIPEVDLKESFTERTPSPPVDYGDHLFRFNRSSSKNNMLNDFQEPFDNTKRQHMKLHVKISPGPKSPIPESPEPKSPVLKSPGPKSPEVKSPLVLAASPALPLPPPPPPLPPPLSQKGFTFKKTQFHSTKELKHFPVPNLNKTLLNVSVWQKLPDLTPNLKFKLLEEKFAVKEKEITKTTATSNTDKVYMNEKKAQNVMILMRGRFLQAVRNVSSALVSIEELSHVTLEDIRILRKYQPDADEIEMYQRLLSEEVELKPVDDCMLKLSLVPCFRDRLELIHTIWSFTEENIEFVMSVSLVSQVWEEILHSERLVKVLAYVLAIFNYLNSSGSRKFQALPGFDLNYLSNLDSIRGTGNYTVLKVLKCHLIDDNDNTLQEFHEDLKSLLQCEPFSIKSLAVSLEVWKQTMANIKNLLASIEKRMKKPSENDFKFFADVKAFQAQKMKEHGKISQKCTHIQKVFNGVLKKFALSPQTSSEKFFGNLQKFVRDYINIT